MKKIQLTQGKVALVDNEDFEYLNQWKWYAHWNKDTQSYYAIRNSGTYPNRVTIRMSRVVADTPIGLVCDHINHNTLDNQKHNLRNVTYSQNGMNRKSQRKSKLREKNIIKLGNGYVVRVKKDGRFVFDKYFGSIEEARKARDKAVLFWHREFSYLGE